MTEKPVMMIVPAKNGFVVMPFNMNLMIPMSDASDGKKGVFVEPSAQSLGDRVRDIYEDHEPEPLED